MSKTLLGVIVRNKLGWSFGNREITVRENDLETVIHAVGIWVGIGERLVEGRDAAVLEPERHDRAVGEVLSLEDELAHLRIDAIRTAVHIPADQIDVVRARVVEHPACLDVVQPLPVPHDETGMAAPREDHDGVPDLT